MLSLNGKGFPFHQFNITLMISIAIVRHNTNQENEQAK